MMDLVVKKSYQPRLSPNNHLEIDLGWINSHNVDAFKLIDLPMGHADREPI